MEKTHYAGYRRTVNDEDLARTLHDSFNSAPYPPPYGLRDYYPEDYRYFILEIVGSLDPYFFASFKSSFDKSLCN